MTEEQRKQCEEIIELRMSIIGVPAVVHIPIPMILFSNTLHYDKMAYDKLTIGLIISLAKVFNKDITEEKAFYIAKEMAKEIVETNYNKVYPLGYSKVDFIKNIGWAIANYFDNNKENDDNQNEENKNFNNENKINNVVENTAKEKIMSNNNDKSTLNLLILGQTGVGKSSFINALVGKKIEEMGHGSKIGIYPYETEIDGKKVMIYDSWGLEAGKDEEWGKIVNEELNKMGSDKDIKDWFHSVTYCIQAGGLKIQDFDIKIIKQFIDKKYNVIIALTKADQIDKETEKAFIEIIKKETETNMVIPISANHQKLRDMTESPKPFGLEEYKEAILISWNKIFIDRIPLYIIEKLKEDIKNAKINAPRKGNNLEKLAKEIQEYFINVLQEKLKNHIIYNVVEYYKITADILASSKNIDIFGNLIRLIDLNINKSKKIDEFINEVSQTIIDKISEEEFESEIRKIIIDILNEIDKKNKNFNNENKINNVVENTAKEKIMTEEQYKKCEEIINSYEEKYNKDLEEALSNIRNIPEMPEMPESEIKTVKNYISALLFYYDKSDSEWNITSPLHLEPIPQDKAKAKFYELLAEPKNKTVENIIDLTVSLSEVLSDGITKEESEKLLFNKKSTEIYGTLSYLNIFTGATEKFIKIMKSHEKGYLEYENYEEEICSIKNMGWAIANYFDNDKENKINNAVENTAKEKIMSNNDESTFNLLILGKTGTGKSSLINALVGKEVAKVSDVEPETDDIYPYPTEIDGKKITIYDSWGMEVGKEKIWDDIVNKKLKEKGIDKPIEEWFHSVTYCIQAGGNRIEDFDAKIITKFIKGGYRVIVALTKAEQMGRDDREKFIERIKERIKKEIEKEETDNDININDIIVISVSASPKKLDYMTEAPKLFGLEEYKAAILISWREIFINRIPIHIIEKLKEDIKNAKINAPKKGKGKELSNKIQEYFSDILNKNIQKYIRESIEKYYKITADILTASKNINLSNKKLDLNFYSEFERFETTKMFIDAFRDFGDFDFGDRIKLILLSTLAIPLDILIEIIRPLEFLVHLMEKGDKIEKFINDVSDEYIKKISEKEFESEIRKIIINTLNEIDKKTIKLN